MRCVIDADKLTDYARQVLPKTSQSESNSA
jgi:hypothetical protein